MKFRASALLVCCVAALLSACGETEEAGFLPDLRDPTNDNLNLANAAAAPATPPAEVPTSGSVTYVGVVAASTSGAYVGSLYADLTMAVDFGGGEVSGSISNVDLLDDNTGEVIQDLDGTLALTGTQTDTAEGASVGGTATGSLTGSGAVNGVSTATLELDGTVRTDGTSADTVFGTMTGEITGAFDLDLSNGEFFGATN